MFVGDESLLELVSAGGRCHTTGSDGKDRGERSPLAQCVYPRSRAIVRSQPTRNDIESGTESKERQDVGDSYVRRAANQPSLEHD